MADAEIDPTAVVADAPEPLAETPEEEKPEAEVEPSNLDYKAIADAEKARADDAEKAAADLAFKLREANRKPDDTEVVPTEPAPVAADKPLTVAELDRILTERDQASSKKAQETQALEIARKNTTSEDEAQAAFQTWRSRVQPSGNLEQDVLFAIGGIHSRKIVGQSAEVKRAKASEGTVTVDAIEAHRDPALAPEVKIAPHDAQALKAAGMSWDGTKRLYKKPLSKDGKGKFLYYDPKAKKRWVA